VSGERLAAKQRLSPPRLGLTEAGVRFAGGDCGNDNMVEQVSKGFPTPRRVGCDNVRALT